MRNRNRGARLAVVVAALTVLALSAAPLVAQEAPKYQSVAPKKKPAPPADAEDVATLTGRPVPESVAARPQPRNPEETGNDPKARKGAPLNPDDVDVLTGKYGGGGNPAYRPYGAEALWTLEWMERNGYGPGDSLFTDAPGRFGRDTRFVPGAFGPGARPFLLHHRRGFARGILTLQHFLRGGAIFIFP